MQPAIYRFEFDEPVSMTDVETTLHLAILGAEGLFGESSVRMDGAYSIDERRRVCIVEARNEVGRSISQLFTGYLLKELGPDAFHVRRVEPRSVEALSRSVRQCDSHARKPGCHCGGRKSRRRRDL